MSNEVLISGCFDLLHSGHIAFLESAAKFGPLVVSLGSDATIRGIKGRAPVCSEQERAYMLRALRCVHDVFIASGSGLLDFEPELRLLRPAKFVVNRDGDHAHKRQLCEELDIEYIVLEREPVAGLVARSSTTLRGQGQHSIPARLDLAGGWFDQPFVSRVCPGDVIVVSIFAPEQLAERAGLASSTRATACRLWGDRLPPGERLEQAHLLFAYENPPDKRPVTGSQDALGVMLPGIHRLRYAGRYWPDRIESLASPTTESWLEQHVSLLLLPPRPADFDVFAGMQIEAMQAQRLAAAADDAWRALQSRDLLLLKTAFNRTSAAQASLFPASARAEYVPILEQLRAQGLGVKFAGAGGGGYLMIAGDQFCEGAIGIRVRRFEDDMAN